MFVAVYDPSLPCLVFNGWYLLLCMIHPYHVLCVLSDICCCLYCILTMSCVHWVMFFVVYDPSLPCLLCIEWCLLLSLLHPCHILYVLSDVCCCVWCCSVYPSHIGSIDYIYSHHKYAAQSAFTLQVILANWFFGVKHYFIALCFGANESCNNNNNSNSYSSVV